MPRLRRAGSPWRILVHEWLGTASDGGTKYGRAYDISSDPQAAQKSAEVARKLAQISGEHIEDPTAHHVFEGTEFDELVVGKWIHLEALDATCWYANIGGVFLNIRVDRDGRPKHVDVFGPGDYDDPVEGCTYSLTWTRADSGGNL